MLIAALPELRQREFEQRQPARLLLGMVQDPIDEAGLELDATSVRRLFHRAPQFSAGQLRNTSWRRSPC